MTPCRMGAVKGWAQDHTLTARGPSLYSLVEGHWGPSWIMSWDPGGKPSTIFNCWTSGDVGGLSLTDSLLTERRNENQLLNNIHVPVCFFSPWFSLPFLSKDMGYRLILCSTWSQERIEPAKLAREHVIPYIHNVNGEIQTWQTLTIYSSYQIWSETHMFNRPRAQAFDTHSDRSMACLPFDSSKLAGEVSCT